MEYPDIFNYLQWSAYAFPLAFVLWLINVSYHMLLINCITKKPMTSVSMNEARNGLLKTKQSIPKKISLHEILTVLFTFLSLLIFFLRWNRFQNNGWADNHQPTTTAAPEADRLMEEEERAQIRMRAVHDDAPVVKDASVAAMFVIILHLLPKSLDFLNIFKADKKSQLKNVKPESGILFWRFLDQNINYGYFFLIGSGVALYTSIYVTGLGKILGENLGKQLTGLNWFTALFIVSFVSVVLANMMTGVAALVVFLPFVLHAGQNTATSPWPSKHYLPAVAVAIGSSFGFMCPFMYTPAYFCHYVGKVPKLKMAKYSLPMVLISILLLWFSLCYWAPYIWDPKDGGIRYVKEHLIHSAKKPTTPAAEAPPA